MSPLIARKVINFQKNSYHSFVALKIFFCQFNCLSESYILTFYKWANKNDYRQQKSSKTRPYFNFDFFFIFDDCLSVV